MEELSVTELDRDIGDLELPEIKMLSPEATVFEAIELFRVCTDGLIAIGEEGKLAGILTEWDLVHEFSPEIDPKDVKILELALENPVTLQKDNSIYEAMNVMGRRNFAAFPVCDEAGNVKCLFNTQVLFNYITSCFSKFLQELGTKEVWEPTKSLTPFSEGLSYSVTMNDDSSLHQNYFLTPFEHISSSNLLKADHKITIGEAWRLILEYKAESLILTQFGTKLVGILTLRDLISKVLLHKGEVDINTSVTNYMTHDLHSLLYKHPIGYGINQFMKHNYKHMIIVDEDRIPLKVVSLLEIFSHLVDKIKLN